MGGVNTTRDYATTMGFGEWDPQAGLVKVTHPLLQGGIVRSNMGKGMGDARLLEHRQRSTIYRVLS